MLQLEPRPAVNRCQSSLVRKLGNPDMLQDEKSAYLTAGTSNHARPRSIDERLLLALGSYLHVGPG